MSAFPIEQPVDPEVVTEIVQDLKAQLARVRATIEELEKSHERALILQRVYAGDPVTRERFAFLHTNIQEFSARMAALREDERLLVRWTTRAEEILQSL